MTIRAEDKVLIGMTVMDWNAVLGMLGEHPFKIVAPIIGQITYQVQAAIDGGEDGKIDRQAAREAANQEFRTAWKGNGLAGEGTGKLPNT